MPSAVFTIIFTQEFSTQKTTYVLKGLRS
jgi:hypothetical protein